MSIPEVLPEAELDWRFESPPSWLDAWEPDWEFDGPGDSPVALLLVDEQQHGPSRSVSTRIVRRLLRPEGLETFRKVEIPFDAQTRRLSIHDLVIWSQDDSGTWQGRSVADSVLFRFRQPDQQAGRASAVALLDHLEPGDAIDVSWTLEPLESPDPTGGLPFTTLHGFVWRVPCAITHFTIHSAPDTPVRWQLHCPDGIEPPDQDLGPGRRHWRQLHPPVTRSEPDAPPGVWNFPLLEASCWNDWGEVAAFTHAYWAEALDDASFELRDAAAKLGADGDPEASLTRAIRFVQDEIDSTEGGTGAGIGVFPADAGRLIRRRSGDAKDKAVFLSALLRQLGVDAWPVLVNPDWQETLTRLLPSSAVFNHVIVTFVVDGQRHFVDPAEGSQRGGLDQWLPPSYGYGLEVRPGVTGLIPLPPLPMAELTLSETFRLDPKGKSGSVAQELRATRWLADEMREAIARDGRTSFVEAHLEALRDQFPSLESDPDTMDLREDAATDAVEMRSLLALPTWGEPEEPPPEEFRYRANGLFLAVDRIEQPEERTVARALRHPMRVRHVVTVEAAFIRKAAPEKRQEAGPGFRYCCDATWEPGRATFDHVWESTAPRVEASEWAEHCRASARVSGHLEVVVPSRSRLTSPVNLRSAVFFSLLAAGLVGGLGVIAKVTGIGPWQAKALPPAPEIAVVEPTQPALTPTPPVPEPPTEVQAEVQMALNAAVQGDLASAAPLLEKRQDAYQENAAFQFVRAEVALRTGQLERAREALERAKTLDPTHVNGPVLTALLQREEGNPSGARQTLTEAVERHPDDPRPLRELAVTLAILGDNRGARDAWQRVLGLTPGDPDALRQYAVLLWQNAEPERADAVIRDALAAQSGPNPALEAAVGDYYTLTGRRAEALDQLEKAASLSPGDRTRDIALASGHLRLGRAAEAAELATRLTRDFPTDVRGWQVLAVAKSILGDPAGAETAYREWLRLAPQDPNGPANFGFFLHQTGRTQEARDLLAKSTFQFPDGGMIWLNYAAVLDALGEQEAAAAAKAKASGLLSEEEKQLMVR